MVKSAQSAIAEIRRLDAMLLAAVAGQETEVVGWIADRQGAIDRFIQEEPSLPIFEELQDRTRRLEDRFLHWRRSSIMELSLIEQHLRYLHEQQTDANRPVPVRINVSA